VTVSAATCSDRRQHVARGTFATTEWRSETGRSRPSGAAGPMIAISVQRTLAGVRPMFPSMRTELSSALLRGRCALAIPSEHRSRALSEVRVGARTTFYPCGTLASGTKCCMRAKRALAMPSQRRAPSMSNGLHAQTRERCGRVDSVHDEGVWLWPHIRVHVRAAIAFTCAPVGITPSCR
jgi:hypothetical protein